MQMLPVLYLLHHTFVERAGLTGFGFFGWIFRQNSGFPISLYLVFLLGWSAWDWWCLVGRFYRSHNTPFQTGVPVLALIRSYLESWATDKGLFFQSLFSLFLLILRSITVFLIKNNEPDGRMDPHRLIDRQIHPELEPSHFSRPERSVDGVYMCNQNVAMGRYFSSLSLTFVSHHFDWNEKDLSIVRSIFPPNGGAFTT